MRVEETGATLIEAGPARDLRESAPRSSPSPRFTSMRLRPIVVTLIALATPVAHAAPPSPARPPRALSDLGEAADPAPLADAVAAYEAKKPQTAAYELHALLREGAWPDHEGKITYFLALSLSDLGMSRAAEHHLAQVAKRGPSDPWFSLAVSRLAAIASRTGDDTTLARLAARIQPDDAPPAARDALTYLRGVRLYEAGELSAARAALAKVSPSSELHPRARYLTGVLLNRQDRLKSAAKAFREVAGVDGGTPRTAREEQLRDLAVLDLGRIHYGVGQYDTADAWYARVPKGSAYWPQSVFESAWANFLLNDPGRTLGQVLSLQAPSIAEGAFLPEAPILAALTWFQLCEYAEVSASLDRFEARYAPMHAEMGQLLKGYATEEGKARAGEAFDRYFGPRPAETVLPQGLFARLLRDRELEGAVQRLRAIDAEEALVRAQKAAWRDTVGEDVLAVLAADRERTKRRGGLALLRQVADTRTYLGELLGQADILRFEHADTRWRNIDRDRYTYVEPERSRPDTPFAVSTDKVYWPFNGEFWEDELGSYRYAVSSSCR